MRDQEYKAQMGLKHQIKLEHAQGKYVRGSRSLVRGRERGREGGFSEGKEEGRGGTRALFQCRDPLFPPV